MKGSFRGCCVAGFCGVLTGICVVAAPPAGGYHLLKKIPLGAAPGGGECFDYITVDSGARRVYLSHVTEVKVLDADSSVEVGTITGFKRSHGVALATDLGRIRLGRRPR